MNEDKRQWVEKGLQLAVDLGNVYGGYAWAEAVAALTKHLETVPEVTVNVPEFVGAGIYSYSETVGGVTVAASAETLWELKDIWKTMGQQAEGSGGDLDLDLSGMQGEGPKDDISPDFFREALDMQDKLIDHLREALEAKTTDGQNALRAELAAANTELEDLRDDARRFTDLQFKLNDANDSIDELRENHTTLIEVRRLLGLGSGADVKARVSALITKQGWHAAELRAKVENQSAALKELNRANEVIKELRSDLLRNSTLRAELRDVLGISTDADILGAVGIAVSQRNLCETRLSAMDKKLVTLRGIEPISTEDASGPILVFQFWNGEDLRKASKEWDTFCKFMGPVR